MSDSTYNPLTPSHDNVYATNFRLNVLCLKHIELALESTVLKEVAESMAHSNTDRQEEYLAQARLDFIRSFGSVYKSGVNEGHREAAAIIAEKDTVISEMDAAISERDTRIAALEAEIASLKKQ